MSLGETESLFNPPCVYECGCMWMETPESPEEEAESLDPWLPSKPTPVLGTECGSFARALDMLTCRAN